MVVVAVNLGAGPTTAFVALMDKPGTVHTAAAIGDRLLIQSMSEVPEGISIDYLDRRPDQAGADAPTVPYRVVFNATTGQLSTPAPLSPAPPTTATAPPRTFVMNDGAHTRAGPSTGTAVRGDVFRGQAVAVVCQTVGELVTNGPATDAGSEVWDRLADGNYVADLFVETPKQMSTNQGLSVPVPSDSLPRC